MNSKIEWHHVIVLVLVLLGVAAIFSMETGKPANTSFEGIAIDATSILIMGG